jgi:hypothetical protein
MRYSEIAPINPVTLHAQVDDRLERAKLEADLTWGNSDRMHEHTDQTLLALC